MNLNKFDKILVIFLVLFAGIFAIQIPQTFDFLILNGHSGWAGPHMIGVSANMSETTFLTRVERIYSDGGYKPYNHHPPLFFIIHSLVLDMASNLDQKLRFSYSLASFFWFIGLVSIFVFLRSHKVSYLISSFAICGLAFSWFSSQFLFLSIFDSLSILLSMGMFSAILSFEKSSSKSALIFLYLISALALFISWYVVFIIFFYGAWKIMKSLYLKGFKSTLTNKIFLYCLIMTILTFFSFSIMYLQVSNIMKINLGLMLESFLNATVSFGAFPQVDRNYFDLFLKQLWASFSLMPLLLLYLAILILLRVFKQKKLFNELVIKNYLLFQVALVFLVACLTFHFIMFRWSNIHPFIFIWLMPIFTLIFALAMENFVHSILSVNNLAIKMTSIIGLILISAASLLVPIQKISQNQIFDQQISFLYEDFKKISLEQKSVIQVIRNENRSKFCPNEGVDIFLSSHPNLSFRGFVPEDYQHIVINCIGDETRINNITKGFSKVIGE